jgi:hypothetical protein
MKLSCDRLDTSGNGLVVIALVSFIAFAVIAILSIQTHRDSQQTTQLWITYLALQTPAIVPSGHVMRNAGYAGPAIDRRQSPHLPRLPNLQLMDFSLEKQMAGSLKPARGEMPLKD